jgi:uncharacterized membrane protein YfcA
MSAFFAHYTLLTWVGVVVTGLGVGYLSGLLGVGGGFMLTPLLIFLLRVPPSVAVGSGMAQMIAVGLGASLRHQRAGYTDLRLAAAMAPGILLGTVLGHLLLRWLERLGTIVIRGCAVGVTHLALSLLFLLLLAWVAFHFMREPVDEPSATSGALRWAHGPLPLALPVSGIDRISAVPLLLGGLLVGIMGGLLGVGGGVVLIPLLVVGFGVPTRTAIGTSSAIILLTAVVVTVQSVVAGAVDWALVLVLMLGSSIGVQIGAGHSHRLAVVLLHRVFAVLALVVALIVLIRLCG